MQSQKMTYMRASSYPRMSPDVEMDLLDIYSRTNSPGAVVIGNTWLVMFSLHPEWPHLFSGKSCMILPPIQNQIFSNRNDFSTQTEVCAMILP